MTTSIHFPFCALSLALTLAVTSAWPARAQMVTGAAMEDFGKSFGLSAKGWSVQQTACSLGANALWPGEEAAFTFFVKPGQPYKGPVKVDVIHYGTRGKPGDWWKPVVFKIADTSSEHRGRRPAGGGRLRDGEAEDRRCLRRLRAHLRSRRAGTRLRGHLRSRAGAGAGAGLAADLRHGPGLAARDVARWSSMCSSGSA